MTMQHIMIPLHPYTEPQRRWVEQSTTTIKRYLAATYRDDDDGRAMDAMFLHIAADVIWDLVPEEPDWGCLSVVTLLLHLADAPAWDDTWLLHACASVTAFYRWLETEGLVATEEATLILSELDQRIVETMEGLGLLDPRGLPN